LQCRERKKCRLPGKFTAWQIDFFLFYLWWRFDENDGSNWRLADGAGAGAAVLENPDDAAADDEDDENGGNGMLGGVVVVIFHAQLGVPPSGLLLWSLDASCINKASTVLLFSILI
jgi:hypothetical protein